MPDIKPIVLCIIDGWGVAPAYNGNAITEAELPNIEKIISQYPLTTLEANGKAIGLPTGEAGNSRDGHFVIGTGQKISRDLLKINKSIEDESFLKNEVFLGAMNHAKENNSNIHLLGLISDNDIYSSLDHLLALIKIFKKNKRINTYLHLVIEGGESFSQKNKDLIIKIKEYISTYKNIAIASISGSDYAMDEYNNWEHTIKTYQALTKGECQDKFDDVLKAIELYTEKKIQNSEIPPTVIIKNSKPVTVIKAKDAVILFNFNSRGTRQLAKCFTLPSLAEFPEREKYYSNLYFVSMVECDKYLPIKIAFPAELAVESLSKILSAHNKKQLFISETEKYPYLSYFFHGSQYTINEGEDKILIPATQTQNHINDPKMSVNGITNQVIKEIKKDIYHFIVVNYANADILGHEGDLEAVIAGLKTVDKNINSLQKAVLTAGGSIIITSSHGNCEEMTDSRTEEINKNNTANPVPFIFIDNNAEGISLHKADATGIDLSGLKPSGSLLDIAPTILKIMKIKQPTKMTGKALI